MFYENKSLIGATIKSSPIRGYISGSVSRELEPGRTHLFIFRRSDMNLIQTQKSKKNGKYIFYGIPFGAEYLVVSIDHKKQHNAAIADRITPVGADQL